MNPEIKIDQDNNINEDLPSLEKNKVETAKKAQKDFEAVKLLKVFLKNTKGKTGMQKELLMKALKLDKKTNR